MPSLGIFFPEGDKLQDGGAMAQKLGSVGEGAVWLTATSPVLFACLGPAGCFGNVLASRNMNGYFNFTRAFRAGARDGRGGNLEL